MPILLLLPEVRTFCASLAPDRYQHLYRSVTAACLCASLFPWTGRIPRADNQIGSLPASQTPGPPGMLLSTGHLAGEAQTGQTVSG